jgi:hypothetical protein
MSVMSIPSASNIQQLVLPRVNFPPFKKGNYRTWADMAKSFFIQHKLFGIVNGSEPNPAGNVLPQSHDGEIRFADGTILDDGDRNVPAPLWSEETKNIWEWNRKHTLVYGFLKGALIEEPTAYAKVIDCTTAQEIWTTLAKEYGQSSNVMLRVLESMLQALYKEDGTSMADHVDKYSQLIEQINYHLKPAEKWTNERINCTFFGTLDGEKWGAYEDGLSETINDMLPTKLYAWIKARDAAKRQNDKRAASTINGGKEANFTSKDGKDLKSRIGGKHSRRRGKRGNGGSKSNDSHPYRRPGPDKDYVKRMKQQWGDDYIDCGHCHYPGHTSDNCRKRASENKSNKGNSHQRNNNGNYQPNFTGFNNGGNIANITELQAHSTV